MTLFDRCGTSLAFSITCTALLVCAGCPEPPVHEADAGEFPKIDGGLTDSAAVSDGASAADSGSTADSSVASDARVVDAGPTPSSPPLEGYGTTSPFGAGGDL